MSAYIIHALLYIYTAIRCNNNYILESAKLSVFNDKQIIVLYYILRIKRILIFYE